MNDQTQAAMEKSSTFREAVEYDVESHDGREEQLLSYILARPNLRGSPAKLLAAIDEFSATEQFLISIGGHKADILADLIAKEKPKIVLELGSYLGYSAIGFADAMRKAHGSSEGLKIWSIEMTPGCAAIATQFIEIAGLADIVTVVVGKADEVLKKLKADGKVEHADFLFLDHLEEIYMQDFKVCVELGYLKRGTLIAADNAVRPGAPEYVEFVRNLPGVESEGVRGLIQPGDYEDEIEISRVVVDKLSL